MNDLTTPIKYLEVRTVGVVFATGSPGSPVAKANANRMYHYYVPDGDDPKVGDVVLTSVEWDSVDADDMSEDQEAHDYVQPMTRKQVAMIALGGKLGRIKEVDARTHPKASKFYMHLIPLVGLHSRFSTNRDMIAQVAERKQLLEKLDTLLLQQSKIEHYKRLAESNPEAAELLKKLQG